MLKLGCMSFNSANICICLHKATVAKFYPFTERDKTCFQKIREDMVGGPSIVFTRKEIFERTFFRISTNLSKSIVGIDAIQLYSYSACHPMPTRLHTYWDINTETGSFIPRQNESRSFENMVLSCVQRMRLDCEVESFYKTSEQKKIDCFSVDGFGSHCNTVFEAGRCFYHFGFSQEVSNSLTEEDIERCIKRGKMSEEGTR